ncbi:MAG: PucC family protein, partial [Betaproteobacteria bacterium]
MKPPAPLSWPGIVRLGLVQTALGSIVVLATSTMNRVMVVELALPALLPGLLVGLHYAIQLLRPRLGHGSDVGGRRTPWIVGGMAVLGLGGVLAALAVALMGSDLVLGIALALAAFAMIGVGVGASGTALLVLLAVRTAPERRPAAATVVWVMMIVGFIVTAATVGRLLDPYTPERLVLLTAAVAVIANAVTLLAVWGIEGRGAPRGAAVEQTPPVPFFAALRQVWDDPQARGFTLFIFVSMLAYSA